MNTELTWKSAQAYIKCAYAMEFSIVEGELTKTTFRACTASAWESSIVFTYYDYNPGEHLIIIKKDSLISATLLPDLAQMLLVYRDQKRGTENQLTVNFLNKYLPPIN